MKKHYVTRWVNKHRVFAKAECGARVAMVVLSGKPKATYRKNHVTCGNCRRTKVFRGVR